MKEIFHKESKKNLIADCLRKELEKNVTDIMRSKVLLKELDQKVDPLVRRYFRELSALFDFFSGEPSPYAEDEDFMRAQKHGVIHDCITSMLVEDAALFLKNSDSLEDVDQTLTSMLESYFGFIDALDAFYGIRSPECIGEDEDNEDDEE